MFRLAIKPKRADFHNFKICEIHLEGSTCVGHTGDLPGWRRLGPHGNVTIPHFCRHLCCKSRIPDVIQYLETPSPGLGNGIWSQHNSVHTLCVVLRLFISNFVLIRTLPPSLGITITFIAFSFPPLSNHYFALAGRYFLGLLERSLCNYLYQQSRRSRELFFWESECLGGWWFSSHPVFTESRLICLWVVCVCFWNYRWVDCYL